MIQSNAIGAIQRQYTTAVNPVHLFEANGSYASQQRTFDYGNQMFKKTDSGYNPFHPNVKTSSLAKNLDIMS